MVCPHCNAGALSPEQRYCHACGALLGAAVPGYEGNVVGDGSRRPLVLPLPAALWHGQRGGRHGGRLLLWGAGVALATLAVIVAVVTLLSAVLMALAVLMPVIVFIAVLGLAVRPRRRRRHRHRHRHRPRGPVVWL